MEPNEIDVTEDLVTAIEETTHRSASELENIAYEDMTEEERKYFIEALKMSNKEIKQITEKAFEGNRKIREARLKDLKLMEDTLTFIKSSIANTHSAINLAIKNMEREVSENGN